jgi:hypothetical protein
VLKFAVRFQLLLEFLNPSVGLFQRDVLDQHCLTELWVRNLLRGSDFA